MFKRFDVGSMPSNSVVCMFGRRETGQNRIVRRLLSFHADIPCVTLISPTEDMHGYYRHYVNPNVVVHDRYSTEVTTGVLERQKTLLRQKKYDDPSLDNRAALVLDDCLFDKAWHTDTSLRMLILNSRRFAVLCILAFQMVERVPPIIRGNSDFTVICRERSKASREKLFELYANVFATFDDFCRALDAITDPPDGGPPMAMVIANCVSSNKLEDQVFCLPLTDDP